MRPLSIPATKQRFNEIHPGMISQAFDCIGFYKKPWSLYSSVEQCAGFIWSSALKNYS